MLGAILGDFIGSRFEYPPLFSKEFELFGEKCELTDDTICSMAVVDLMLHHPINSQNVELSFVSWGQKYLEKGFGKGFLSWLLDVNRKPYQSLGNGCLMRASPIALLSSEISKAHQYSDIITGVSHNHPEALLLTRIYVEGLMLLLEHIKKNHSEKNNEAIKKEIILNYFTNKGLEIKPLENYARSKFQMMTKPTLEIALACLAEASSYEETIRNVVYTGSDSDTTGAIAGAIAELVFGIDLIQMEDFFPYIKTYDIPLLSLLIEEYESSPHFESLKDFNLGYASYFEKLKIALNKLKENSGPEDWIVKTTRKFPK